MMKFPDHILYGGVAVMLVVALMGGVFGPFLGGLWFTTWIIAALIVLWLCKGRPGGPSE